MRKINPSDVPTLLFSKKTLKKLKKEEYVPALIANLNKTDFTEVFDSVFKDSFKEKIKKYFKKNSQFVNYLTKSIKVKIDCENTFGEFDSKIKVKIKIPDLKLVDAEIYYSLSCLTIGISGFVSGEHINENEKEVILINIFRCFFSATSPFVLKNYFLFEKDSTKENLKVRTDIEYFVKVLDKDKNKEKKPNEIIPLNRNKVKADSYCEGLFNEVLDSFFEKGYFDYNNVKDIFNICFKESYLHVCKSAFNEFFDSSMIDQINYERINQNEPTFHLFFKNNIRDFFIREIKFIFYLDKRKFDIYFEADIFNNTLINKYIDSNKKCFEEKQFKLINYFLFEVLFDVIQTYKYWNHISNDENRIDFPSEIDECNLDEIIYSVLLKDKNER